MDRDSNNRDRDERGRFTSDDANYSRGSSRPGVPTDTITTTTAARVVVTAAVRVGVMTTVTMIVSAIHKDVS